MMVTPTQPASAHALWDGVKDAGKRASITGKKAKIGADVMLLENKIKSRKQIFGCDLYDHLLPLVEEDPYFLIESPALDKFQGLFVTAYKDNKALLQQNADIEQKIQELREKRAAVNSRHGGKLSYQVPADSVGERILNFPKNARITGSETKLKANVALIDREILANKRRFGVECYELLVHLEENEHYIPDDRDVRFHYDHARKDVAKLEMVKEEKHEDMDLLRAES